MQQMSGGSPGPGFSGPVESGLQRPRGPLPQAAVRRRAPSLPVSVRNDVSAGIAAMSRAIEAGASVTPVAATLVRRATMGATAAEYERVEAIGYGSWLDEQLDYESLDDSALEDVLADELPTLTMSSGQLFDQYQDKQFVPIIELWIASVYRAAYSPRQLFERMVVFWTDHFNIDIFAGFEPLLKPVDDREVVRKYAMSSFPELLFASAHSPAMLVYLTNDSNVRGHPNENYARELMELHTLGVDNGYTEADVKEVARCFTGWTVNGPGRRGGGEVGSFAYWPEAHDNGKKKVLGKTIPAGGQQSDGERVLEILAEHRNTAEFIATKLLRYLHGYEPPKPAIRAVKRAYQRHDGDIRQMLSKALAKNRMRSATPKLKRPFHLMISSVRALGAQLDDPRFMLESLREAGHLPFNWTQPNGYPDSAAYWSGFVLPRWNFAAEMLDGGRTGIRIDPAVDDPAGGVTAIVDRIDRLLTGGTMSAATRGELRSYLRGRKNRKRVREAIGLGLSSPEFQEY